MNPCAENERSTKRYSDAIDQSAQPDLTGRTYKSRFDFPEETAHRSLTAGHADYPSPEPPVASFLEETDVVLPYEQAFIATLWL